MSSDMRARELLQWVKDARASSTLNEETAQAMISAWQVVMGAVGPPDWRERQIGSLDYLGAFDEFAARQAGDRKPETVAAIRGRMAKAVALYDAWLDEQSHDGKSAGLDVPDRRHADGLAPDTVPVPRSGPSVPPQAATRAVVFPLRMGFDVVVTVPVDLDSDERSRLSDWVRLLPATPSGSQET